MRRPVFLLVASAVLVLTGCAGYKLGPSNGMEAGSRSIQVNLFQNQTPEPRLIEAIATALRRDVQQDGTFLLNTHGDADVVVSGAIVQYDRSALSFDPTDVRIPRDLLLVIGAKVSAIERTSGKSLVDQTVYGQTIIRAGADLTSAERQAVPLLAQDLARNITSLLVDGKW